MRDYGLLTLGIQIQAFFYVAIQMIKSPCQILWLKPPLLQSAPLLGCNPDLDGRIRIILKKVIVGCIRRRRKKIYLFIYLEQSIFHFS